MNAKLNHCIIIGVILAVLTYFSIHFIASPMLSPLAVSIAVLAGAILTPIIASIFTSNTLDSSELAGEITTLYVGNLPYRANEEAVKSFFEGYTRVQSVRLMKDKRTGKRKGYGFVEINEADVSTTIEQLNDSIFQDRTLKVRQAKEKVSH